MRLRAEQLDAHLAKTLACAYLVYGDEPLVALEAADAIRAAARARGHEEREVLTAERGFDWSALAHACAGGSLFAAKKVVELRLGSGRMPAAGAHALVELLERPAQDVVLLASMPKPEGKDWWKAHWFTAFEAAGVIVEAAAVARTRLPRWIGERLARQGQRASPEALEYLAARVEGNLLAAKQEIAKLALLAPQGEIGLAQVREAVASVARYDFDALAEALYDGDLARYARALAGLQGEGESAASLAWRLGEELAALGRVQEGLAAGEPKEALFSAERIYRAAQPRCERALARLSASRLREAAVRVARIERSAKGVGTGDPWDGLLRLGLEFAHGSGT
jgi:DNA polymerase-3 subunit delta